MSTLSHLTLTTLLAATGLVAQQAGTHRSGIWVGRGSNVVLYDAFGNDTRYRSLQILDKVWRASGDTLAGFDITGLSLRVSGNFPNRAVLPSVGIDIATDRNQQIWLIRDSHTGIEAYDYKVQLIRTLIVPGQPRAMCLTGKNELWVCQDGNPGAFLSWFDAASPNPVHNLVTLPPSFGTASQMLAGIPQNGKTKLWLINDKHGELLQLGDQGQVLATYSIGTTPNEYNRAIFFDNEGDLWILTSRGLYEWRAATQTARFDRLTQLSDTFHFDAAGTLWRLQPGQLIRYLLSNARPDTRVNLSGRPFLHGDPSGLYRAMIVDPTGDADGDGEGNLAEIRIGTDPYDASSNANIHLRLERVLHPIATQIEMDLLGSTQPSILLIGLGFSRFPQTFPGITGELRIAPIPGVILSVPFDGRIKIPIPDDPSLRNLKLVFQAFTTNGNRLSNHTSIVVPRDTHASTGERFWTSNKHDIERSGGTWANGQATPGKFGGIGLLGSFDPTLGNEVAPKVYVWNTDQMTIPSSHTLFGSTIAVTNGRFGFTDFKVPAGVTVHFEGSHAAIINVRGRIEINGRVTVNGHDVPQRYNGAASGIITYIPNPGQAAVPGGAGGGAGGRGGKGHAGAGPDPLHSGQHGDDLVVPGASGYSGVVSGTGGRGSGMFPATGLNSSLTYNYGGVVGYVSQTTSGGGGGGYLQLGGIGTAIQAFSGLAIDLGPNTAGGLGVTFIPLPPGATAMDHFLIGGSGGGGTASHPLAIQRALIVQSNYPWHGGGAGAGGGGALAFLSGGDFVVGPAGSLEAQGGNGDPILGGGLLMSFGQFPPSPGGAGSGGTIVIQSDGAQFIQQGSIDVTGGSAGMHRSRGPLLTGNAKMDGGVGAPGSIRIEQTGLTAKQLGTVKGITISSQHWSAQVSARADWSGSQSLWYPTGLEYAPTYDYYELTVRVNGKYVIYTDDPARYNPANQPGHHVSLFVQGAQFDLAGVRVSEPTVWRDRIHGAANSLNSDNANGFRFMLLFDPSVFQNAAVTLFRIVYH